jgi:hypothetical protein
MMDRDLLNILACPACKKSVVFREDRSDIKCTGCKRVYPVRKGIPIMLVEESTVEDIPEKPLSGTEIS